MQTPEEVAEVLIGELDHIYRPGQLPNVVRALDHMFDLPANAMQSSAFHRLVAELCAKGKVTPHGVAFLRGRQGDVPEKSTHRDRRLRDMRMFAQIASAVACVVRRGLAGKLRQRPPSLLGRRWRWCTRGCAATRRCGRLPTRARGTRC